MDDFASSFPEGSVVSVIHAELQGPPALQLILAAVERAGGEIRQLDYRQDAIGRFARLQLTEISDGWSERLVAGLNAMPGVPRVRLEHQILRVLPARGVQP